MSDAAFKAFIDSAWNNHGDRPDDVASRLAGSLAVIATADDVAPYVRLVTHVYGEHLGRWDDGVALVESIRALPACADGAHAIVDRSIAALRYAAGDSSAVDRLSRDDRVSAIATASTALTGRERYGEAVAALSRALALADGLPPGSPAIRALAIGGNNLAAALEQKRDRSADETGAMVRAARAGLEYWKLAGTWLEEERAEYRLSRSLCVAGDHRGAVDAAARCVDVCARNDAPAFESFFAYTALALAHRATGDRAAFDEARTRALHFHALVPTDERHWCTAELALLNG